MISNVSVFCRVYYDLSSLEQLLTGDLFLRFIILLLPVPLITSLSVAESLKDVTNALTLITSLEHIMDGKERLSA